MIYNPYTPHKQDRADEWTDSELNAPTDGEEQPEDNDADEQCASIFEQVEQAQLRKPTGKCVTLKDHNGVEWMV